MNKSELIYQQYKNIYKKLKKIRKKNVFIGGSNAIMVKEKFDKLSAKIGLILDYNNSLIDEIDHLKKDNPTSETLIKELKKINDKLNKY